METMPLEMPLSGAPTYRITKENAAWFAQRSWEARKAKAAQQEAEAKAGREATPQSKQLADELDRLLGLIRESEDADEIQKLSAARSRLFAEWQVLTGTPNPGSRKSGKPSRTSLPLPDPEPITPSPAAPSTPV